MVQEWTVFETPCTPLSMVLVPPLPRLHVVARRRASASLSPPHRTPCAVVCRVFCELIEQAQCGVHLSSGCPCWTCLAFTFVRKSLRLQWYLSFVPTVKCSSASVQREPIDDNAGEFETGRGAEDYSSALFGRAPRAAPAGALPKRVGVQQLRP